MISYSLELSRGRARPQQFFEATQYQIALSENLRGCTKVQDLSPIN